METKDLRDLVEFAEGAAVHRSLFESERLWSEVLCLERNQRHGPISDPQSDGLFVVVAGEVVVQMRDSAGGEVRSATLQRGGPWRSRRLKSRLERHEVRLRGLIG